MVGTFHWATSRLAAGARRRCTTDPSCSRAACIEVAVRLAHLLWGPRQPQQRQAAAISQAPLAAARPPPQRRPPGHPSQLPRARAAQFAAWPGPPSLHRCCCRCPHSRCRRGCPAAAPAAQSRWRPPRWLHPAPQRRAAGPALPPAAPLRGGTWGSAAAGSGPAGQPGGQAGALRLSINAAARESACHQAGVRAKLTVPGAVAQPAWLGKAIKWEQAPTLASSMRSLSRSCRAGSGIPTARGRASAAATAAAAA